MDEVGLDQPVLQDDALLSAMDDPMDDLFGDATDALVVPLPPIPLPASIILRLDNMRRSGCCTTLTYANTGSIMSISGSGKHIQFRTMLRDQSTGIWSLSNPSHERLDAPPGKCFVHLQPSSIGIELAAVDNSGDVHLYSLTGALSRMQLSSSERNDESGGRAGLDSVVGLHWLSLYPTQFRSPIISSAFKIDGHWTTRLGPRDLSTSKVHHPADNRNALLYVTSAGRLTLCYQNELNIWHSVSTDLSSFTSPENLLTHCSMGEYKDGLLLAAHDIATRLSLYMVSIDWNMATNHQGNLNIVTVAPVVSVRHLAAVERVCPGISDAAKLTHLRVLALPEDGVETNGPAYPTIMAVFIHAVSVLDTSPQVQDSFSVLARWQVDTVSPQLHESFSKLKPNATVSNLNTVTYLKRQPDIITNKIILTVDLQAWNSILALAASDGTVDFRDRASFATIEPSFDATDNITSLPQSGLEHMPIEHHPIVALSPDGSVLVYQKSGSNMAAKTMTLRYGWQQTNDGLGSSKAAIEAAVVCLARQYALLCYGSVATDDPITILPPDASNELKVLFIKQIIRMTNGKPDVALLDLPRQQMAMLRDPFIPRALSAQLVTGTLPDGRGRSLSGQLAYLLLNLKLVGTAFASTLNQRSPDIKRADSAACLCGSARWSTDLIVYIVDSIMPSRLQGPSQTARQVFEKSAQETQNPSIFLLLCATSRAWLRYHLMHIQHYVRLVQMSIPKGQSISERQQLLGILEMNKNMPFTYKAMLDLVTEFDTAVREVYRNANISAERRLEIELAMLTECTIPEELTPALQTLTETIIPTFNASADLSKLFFWNPSSFEMVHFPTAQPNSTFHATDAILKVPLTPDMKLRVCRRCGAQMEDMTPDQIRSAPVWLGHGLRHCYCLNYWWVA